MFHIDTGFLEEPADGERTVFVAVNSIETFSCHVADGYRVYWEVLFPEINTWLLIYDGISEDIQRYAYIEKTDITLRRSVFAINFTQNFNQTVVRCVAYSEVKCRWPCYLLRDVLVTVYGRFYIMHFMLAKS